MINLNKTYEETLPSAAKSYMSRGDDFCGVKAVKHNKSNKQKKPFWNMLADGVPKENGAYLISIHHTNTEDGEPEDEVWVAYWGSDLRKMLVAFGGAIVDDKIGGFWNWGVGGTIELEQDVIAWRPLPRPAEPK